MVFSSGETLNVTSCSAFFFLFASFLQHSTQSASSSSSNYSLSGSFSSLVMTLPTFRAAYVMTGLLNLMNTEVGIVLSFKINFKEKEEIIVTKRSQVSKISRIHH